MPRAIQKSFKNWLSFLLIFCVLSPSVSPVLAAPFWENWLEEDVEVSIPEVRRTRLVSILVEEELLEDDALATKIERYAVDVQKAIDGQAILVPISRDTSPLDLWIGNSQLYFSGHENNHRSQLVGTVFIGDVPLPVVDRRGRLHATPWPLTDFDAPSYFWNNERERFVWQGGGDEQAEIWHGVIRSDSSTETGRNLDLRGYFDRNHRVHTGDETFAKKIFIADLPQQRIGISEQQKLLYQNWIDHLEDLSYRRFNKNWVNTMFEDMNPAETVPLELLPGAEGLDMDPDFSALPDAMSKNVIDKMAQRYLGAARETMVSMLQPAYVSGRWDTDELDTTISLIAKKDEWAANLLRTANDEVEDIFRDKLTDPLLDIPAKILLSTEHKYQPYQDILGVNVPLGAPITKELYWNGILLSEFEKWGWSSVDQEMQLFVDDREFPAENCSLLRGTAPEENHSAGQLAEMNRVYNFATAALDTCVDWDGEDTDDDDREDHVYEGCCAQNIAFGGSGFELSAPDCRANSTHWDPICVPVEDPEWQCGLSALEHPLPLLINWEYIGAEAPVFDLKGARPVTTGLTGAQGCESLIEELGDSGNQKEISSLMFHDEPRLETLQAQVAAPGVNAMPADDPRGASFYDTDTVFHRIDFPTSFDFIGENGESIVREDQEIIMQSNLETALTNTIDSITSTPGNVGKILITDFDTTFWRHENLQLELVDALLWLGKDLEQKHVEMLHGAFSSPIDGARILGDRTFDGYEIIEVIAETADEKTLKLSFEQGEEDPSNTFQNAKRESNSFHADKDDEQEMDELLFPSTEKEECSGENIIFWPIKCLIPWVAALPEVILQTIPVLPELPALPSLPGFPELPSLPELSGLPSLPQLRELKKQREESVLTSLVVDVADIVITSKDVTPITIVVSLLDQNGGIYSLPTVVSLSSDSADALDFFTISPEPTREAVMGGTQFSLLPRTRDVGGKFSFTISAEGVSVGIPVTVTQNKLFLTVAETEVVAGEVKSIPVKIRALDMKNLVAEDAEGMAIQLTSEQGTFSSGGGGVLENGVAETLFFPGKIAGKGFLSLRDTEALLPEERVEFEIKPADPARILLEIPPVLVSNGVPKEITALVKDRYGNVIKENIPKVDWGDIDEATIKGNTLSLATEETEVITISAQLPEIDSSHVSQEIPVIENPQLLAELTEDSLIAGTKEPLLVRVTTDKELPGLFDVFVIGTEGIGLFDSQVTLEDGEVELPIYAGTRAGEETITLEAPGFGSITFTIEILPADPYKIDLTTERTVLQIEDERRNTLLVRVLDRYGNEVPFVGEEITFLQNPGEKWSADDITDLEEAGVFDAASPVKAYLEKQVVDTELTFSPVVEFDPPSARITNGAREIEINTQETGGNLYLVATAVGLIPDTLELEVVQVLKQSEFDEDLSPKSLLTLLLGHDGGNLATENFGNKFLFSGETQAVATLLQVNKPQKISFSLDPSGVVGDGVLKAEVGNEFSFIVNDVVRATMNFEEPPTWNDAEKGWVFSSTDTASISQRENILQRNNVPLLQIFPGGGIRPEAQIFLVGTDSWREWSVQHETDGEIGILSFPENNGKEKTNTLSFESLDPAISVQSFFTGKSTTSAQGVAAVDMNSEEEDERLLKSSYISIENALTEPGIGWTTPWKPGTMFAAGNNIGESVRIAASDAGILLGDPSLSLPTQNTVSALQLQADVGQVLWTSPWGAIDEVVSGDLNGDGRAEIFSRSGKNLSVLYHDRHQLDNFRDAGLLLRFADGVQKIAVHNDSFGNMLHLIQLNREGELVFHRNEKGVLHRESIDLGLTRPIVNIDVAELNGDKYEDLILLDDENSLWFAYGHNEKWYSAQFVDSFAARFEDVEELYNAEAEQAGQQLKIRPFPQLRQFFARFVGVEDSAWSGETRLIQNREFVPFIDNKRFDALYKVKGEEAVGSDGDVVSVVPGQRLLHSLKISGNNNALSELELIIPQSVGFRFEESSFTCAGCNTLSAVSVKPEMLHIAVGALPAHSMVTFSWETIAEEVLPIRYLVRDFEGTDGRDDVSIAWQSDGAAQTIQFLSPGTGAYPAGSAEATEDASRSPILRTHTREIVTVFPDILPPDFDAEATAEDVMECMTTQQDENGMPRNFLSPDITSSMDEMIAPEKKFAWRDALASIALLAPGPQSIYIPPFAIPIPIPAIGFPVLWLAPAPPYVGALVGQFASMFRFYIIPTTSLRLGFAICGGPLIDPSMTPTGIPFPPQCFVIVPQSGGGNDDGGDGDGGGGETSCFNLEPAEESSAKQSLSQQLFAPPGTGVSQTDFNIGGLFIIKPANEPTNQEIKGADILSLWVQMQWKELTNFKFPDFRIKYPKQAFELEKEKEPLDTEIKSGVLQKLKQSPFVEVTVKEVNVSYPEIKKEDLENMKKEVKKWKNDATEKLKEELNEWNEIGCLAFENGEWIEDAEDCQTNPDSSTALGIILVLIQQKMEAVILRLQALPLTVTGALLKLERDALSVQMQAAQERVSKMTSTSIGDYEAEITNAQNKIEAISSEMTIEKYKDVLEKGSEAAVKLDAATEATEEQSVPINEQKISEVKEFLSEEQGKILELEEGYLADIISDIEKVESFADEVDAIQIEGGNAIIATASAKIAEIDPEVSEGVSVNVAQKKAEQTEAMASKKEEISAAAEEKKAEQKEAAQAAFAEKKAAMKEMQEGLKDELKTTLEEIAIEPLEKKWEDFGTAIDKNQEALEGYVTEIKKLKEFPEKLEKILEQVQKMADVVNEYWGTWIEKNERSVEKWKEFGEDVKKTIQAWKEIPEMLKKFAFATSSSNGGSMSRGSMFSWFKNLLLSLIKFPIFKMPNVPDVELDLTDIKIGVNIDVPKLVFSPVKILPPSPPPIPDLNLSEKVMGIFSQMLDTVWEQGDLTAVPIGQLEGILGQIKKIEMSATIPAVPNAPAIPEVIALKQIMAAIPSAPSAPAIPDVMALLDPLKQIITSAIAAIPAIPILPAPPQLPELEVPPLILPGLPTLIEPPKFPDFLKIPNLIMLIPKAFFALLSLLLRGLMPVPEWMVAMSVVNATNRTLILPLDFLGNAKLPAIPKLVLPPLSYKFKWDFMPLPLSLPVEVMAAMFNCVTTQLSNSAKGLSVGECIPGMDMPGLPATPQIPVAALEDRETHTYALLPETESIEYEALDIPSDTTSVFAMAEPSIVPPHMQTWQASTKTISTSDFPQSVPSDFDVDAITSETSIPTMPPEILFFDEDLQEVESIMRYPLNGKRFSSAIVDIDRDGVEEIIFSINAQLFLKRRVLPTMTTEESDAEFEISQNITEWKMDRFAGGFSPTQKIFSSVRADGSMFRFLPDETNEANYFEWIISDRPDRIFESSASADERASNTWRRIGFLVRPPAAKYEIRPAGAQITSVKGSPIMYGVPLNTLDPRGSDFCNDEANQLPFFSEETIFVGTAEKSRLLIKTLARKGQQEEEREIELRKGEETVVDFAEVCLSRGKVQYLEFANTETLVPKKDDYFFSGMRLELGGEDHVELDLFDSTNISIWEGERYELHQFSSREKLISTFKQLSRGNHYGQMKAFSGDHISWTRSKYLLHDPQKTDDVTAPQLNIRRGTQRTVLFGKEIEIDASNSYENQELERVWWEVKGVTLIDSDSSEHSPIELFKILLPAERHTHSFPVVLHALDISGNKSMLSIDIEVVAPKLLLREASARDARLSGKVISGTEGIETWFLRERDGRQEILSRTTTSGKDGSFVLEDLSRQGGALLHDKYTKKTRAEVLKTGRPVLLDEELTQFVKAATEKTPLSIDVREKTGETAMTVSFIAPKKQNISLPKKEGTVVTKISSTEIQLMDPEEDGITWRKTDDEQYELWDAAVSKAIGTLDTQGQFKSLLPSLYLRTQASVDDDTPVVFEVWKERHLLAKFSMPIPEKITIKEENLLNSEKIHLEENIFLKEKVDAPMDFLQNPRTELEKKAI